MKIKFIGVILFCSLNMFGAQEADPGGQAGRVEDGKEGQSDGPSENPFDAATRGRSWSVTKWEHKVHVPDEGGRTPIFYAQNGETINAFLAVGASLKVKDHGGRTPLGWAVETENAEQVRAILKTKSIFYSVTENPDNRIASGFRAFRRRLPYFGSSYGTDAANLQAIRQFNKTGSVKSQRVVDVFMEFRESRHNELAAREMYEAARKKRE